MGQLPYAGMITDTFHPIFSKIIHLQEYQSFFNKKVFAVLGYLDFDLLLYTAFTASTAYRFWLDFPRTAKGFQPFKPN
jgi:hypothetical protein